MNDWTKLVQEAWEIHSIDTAFLHLAEDIFYGQNDRLFFSHLEWIQARSATRFKD